MMSAREEAANKIRVAEDIKFPDLKYWNYSSCAKHDTPSPMCQFRACGGDLWAHQKVGISWLYVRKTGLIADSTGTGKTNTAYGLLALLKEQGELTNRAVVVCQTPAAAQWLAEGHRWVPRMQVIAALSGMTKAQRIQKYSQNWDVLIIGYHLMMKDINLLERLAPGVLIVDDVDPLLNHETKTHVYLNRLKEFAERRVVINATAIQMHLRQIHAALSITDGYDVFGPLAKFERRYVQTENVTLWNPTTGNKSTRVETVGYKNLPEFKEKFVPMYLRRKEEDLHDINMPEVLPPTDVWLEMSKPQKARYTDLRSGVLRVMREEGEAVSKVKALAIIGHGQRICAGLPALTITEPDPKPGKPNNRKVVGYEADSAEGSPKLDWVMKQATEEWKTDKMVVFIKNVGLVEAFQKRLSNAGIGYATIRGQQDADMRKGEIDAFWQDPNCRVMIGTTAIERSLNLQIANKMIFVDMHLNPARVQQIVGRVKRGGSQHKHIFIYNLFMADTQEEKYMAVLQTRQALADYVFEEQNDLFEQLSATNLLELIGGKF